MMMKRTFVALAASGILALIGAPAANAEVVDGVTVGKRTPLVKKTYPGMTASRPGILQGNTNTDWEGTENGWKECRDAEDYCYIIPVTFVPEVANGHRLLLRVEYPSGPDMTFRLWDKEGKRPEGYYTALQASNDGVPEGTSRVQKVLIDYDAGEYTLAAMCNIGADCTKPFTLTANLTFDSIPTFGSGSGFTPSPTSPSTTPTSTPTASTAGASLPPVPPVLSPGADGPASERALKALAVGQQASPPSNALATATNIAVMVLLALVVAGGGTMVAKRIRRDLRS